MTSSSAKDQYLGLRGLRNLDQPGSIAAAFPVLSTGAHASAYATRRRPRGRRLPPCAGRRLQLVLRRLHAQDPGRCGSCRLRLSHRPELSRGRVRLLRRRAFRDILLRQTSRHSDGLQRLREGDRGLALYPRACPAPVLRARSYMMGGFRAGPRGQRCDCCRRRPERPLRLPRVRPPHRSRPRFLPQGDEGDDTIVVKGDRNGLRVCPASALPTAPDHVSFRRAARATTC